MKPWLIIGFYLAEILKISNQKLVVHVTSKVYSLILRSIKSGLSSPSPSGGVRLVLKSHASPESPNNDDPREEMTRTYVFNG